MSKRGPRSEHPHSNVYSVPSAPQQPPPQEPSFLFAINELPVNDDPASGGLIPRVTVEGGHWAPPIYARGFGPQFAGNLYRWVSHDGVISRADSHSDFQWNTALGEWRTRTGLPLVAYRTTTVFYCNYWDHFMTAFEDASTRDIATSEFPNHRWWPLNFSHQGSLSRIQDAAEERLAGRLSPPQNQWIQDLDLNRYEGSRYSEPASGLAGHLTTLIALMAFSCERHNLDEVLIRRRAWRHHRWHSHTLGHGRVEGRGMVVTVYLDPQNLQGSTPQSLYDLEWVGGALLG